MQKSGPIVLAFQWPGGGTPDLPPQLEPVRAQLSGWVLHAGHGWLIAAKDAVNVAAMGDWIVASPASNLIDRDGAKLLSLQDLAAELDRIGPAVLDSLAPPFRLLAVNRRKNQVTARVDRCGLGHLFEASHGPCHVISSSVQFVAEFTEAGPDIAALLDYSQLGVFPFAATPYVGIRKLLPDDPWGTNYAATGSGRPLKALQDDIEAHFRAAVQALLAAAPQAALELSGGLDSRLILAAMTPDQRAGRSALTLCGPGEDSPDLKIARQLARDQGLDHRVSHAPSEQWLDPELLFTTLDAACSGYQGMGNPVDKATLLANGEDSDGLVRFSGQNGEILRGFYHPMQPLAATASRALWSNLTDWRLIANDRVSPRLLSDYARTQVIPAAREAFLANLANFEGEWGQALDRVYLRLRMQAWVGNAASSTLVKRTMLMPFFDEHFLKAALALPAAARSSSQAAYRLLMDIDPTLANVSLESGISPAQLLSGGIATRLASARQRTAKLVSKLKQRMNPRSGATMGSNSITTAWHRHRGFERLDLGRLAALGIFDEQALELLQSGKLQPDRNELGFLLICNGL
ncbi:MAG: hypothetical protein EBR34_04325 [Sphingomonadaceae bacterium]|nr:hypothetical protein [Sphingomonadaceae bacterium]